MTQTTTSRTFADGLRSAADRAHEFADALSGQDVCINREAALNILCLQLRAHASTKEKDAT